MNFFKQPNAAQLAERMSEDFKKQLLNHQTSAAYHTKMAEYCKNAIALTSKQETPN